MTKQYLGRVLDSFTKDLGKFDEEQARDYITRNSEQLARPENVRRRLDMFDVDHSTRVLIYFVLETLLNTPECALEDNELVERIQQREQELIDEAESDDALQYADDKHIDIFRTVLEVAFDDDEISREEYSLLDRLRAKLEITRKQQRIIEAQLDAFPKTGGELHTHPDVKEALLHLQRQGIVFYCNRTEDGRTIVLPEELHEGIKQVVDIELSDNARELLWMNLKNSHLSDILRDQNLPGYGSKEEMAERLLQAETKPSEALDSLMSDDLYEICNSLPGVKVSGSKAERVERIIAHFDNLMIRDIPEGAAPGERFYEYFTELASRDRENLLANDVISKDIDIERAFEEATQYLFQHKLGKELMEMKGSDHPDGSILMDDGTLMMWDNKSKEGTYTFPNTHLKQFKRYIRDSIDHRVNCFMVIVPDVAEEAEQNCLKLKYDSQQHDSDVCIITAEDLKWIAENWQDMSSKDEFNLAVFDQTGILSRKKLEQVMGVLM
ncbi:MAG: hypothetical protein ACQEVA_16620 [Myxococcota bacterium]